MNHKSGSKCDSIDVVPLTRRYLQETLVLLKEGFYPDESICRAVGLAQSLEAMEELDQLSVDTAKDGVSLIALDKENGKVAGVAFNKLQVKCAPHADCYFDNYASNCKHPSSRRLVEFMKEADDLCDLFELCKIDCLLEIMFLAVKPDYRKMGIALKLCQSSIQLAKSLLKGENLKVPVGDHTLKLEPVPKAVSALFTSPGSQKVGEKLKMRVAARLPYDTVYFNNTSFASVLEPDNKDTALVYLTLEENKI